MISKMQGVGSGSVSNYQLLIDFSYFYIHREMNICHYRRFILPCVVYFDRKQLTFFEELKFIWCSFFPSLNLDFTGCNLQRKTTVSEDDLLKGTKKKKTSIYDKL